MIASYGTGLNPSLQLLAAEAAIQQQAQMMATARVAGAMVAQEQQAQAIQQAQGGGNSNSAQAVTAQLVQMLQGLMQNQGGSNSNSSSDAASNSSGSDSSSSSPSAGSSSSSSSSSPASGSGEAAAAEAKKFIGQESQGLKGKLNNFEAAGGQTNNCADFVCSLLKNQDPSLPKTNSVATLKSTLQSRGYKEVQPSNAKAGDVAFSNSGSHVQLVSAPGKTIGSNNDRPGHQVVSERNIGNETILSKA